MKKSILTVLFALCSTIGFAQVSFQVKAGLNLSSYIGENSDHSKFKPGARIGVGMEYQFTDLISLQPSLFFSQKGAKYSSGYEGTVVDADADVKINQLYLAGAVRQDLNGLREGIVFIFHKKRIYISAGMASEAIIHLFVRRHRKGRCFFVMKRTAAPIVASLFFQ